MLNLTIGLFSVVISDEKCHKTTGHFLGFLTDVSDGRLTC